MQGSSFLVTLDCSSCRLSLVLGQALYTFSLWLIPFWIVRTDYVYGGGTVTAEDDKAKMAGGGQGLWSLHTFPSKAASWSRPTQLCGVCKDLLVPSYLQITQKRTL